MLLRRFYDENLAQASYLIGCQATGEALVVDPNRMIDDYLAAASAEGLRISHVTETHIHADFVSGARELAKRAGAQLYLSGEGGPDWTYSFAAEAKVLRNGASFKVGNIRIDAMHTPGHTPEHMVFLVTDGAATTKPMGMISGDFIFAGDVGRPDLLERAANVQGTMHAMARTLYRSLQGTRGLPDYLQLWPGHGAGSACGKALGAIPSTTLGYERLVNWAFQVADEESFVREVLAGQPEAPGYFARMKHVNRDGPPLLPTLDWQAASATIGLAQVESRMNQGTVVVDARPARASGAGHIPGTINIPMGGSFATWVGSLVPHDRDLLIIMPKDGTARAKAVRTLRMMGFDRFVGFADDSIVQEWASSGRTLATTQEIDVATLAERRDVHILDVRNDVEWAEGHIVGAIHVTLANLAERAKSLPGDRPIVAHCKGGSRSMVAASLLRAQGVTDVMSLRGGLDAWKSEGLPIAID